MPEIVFKGKEYVYNHHLTVPYRPLLPQADKGIGPADLGGNLVIHGDNLHALKALMPMYAGKVDCIFIDPPYNTVNRDFIERGEGILRMRLANERAILSGTSAVGRSAS